VTELSRSIVRTVALTAAAALAFAMTACGNDSGDDLPPPASPPTGDSSPAGDPEHQEILDVYYGSVEAMVAAQEASDPDHPDLALYYIERTPAWHSIRNTITRHGEHGAHYTGKLVVVSAEVVHIDHDATPVAATIDACLDDSDYRLVYIDDGSPVEDAAPGGRYSLTATAILGTDDNWYISETTAHWDEPC
jgi:hypothetical protein